MNQNTSDKLNQVAQSCESGFQLYINPHYGTMSYQNGKKSKVDAEEYLRIIKQEEGQTDVLIHHSNDAKAIRQQIIKKNKIVELWLFTDPSSQKFYRIIHYDLTLALQDAWELMTLLGKIKS